MRPTEIERGDFGIMRASGSGSLSSTSAAIFTAASMRPGFGMPFYRFNSNAIYLRESGRYRLNLYVAISTGAAGYGYVRLVRNGTLIARGSTGRVDSAAVLVSTLELEVPCTRGDVIQMAPEYSMSGPLSTDSVLYIEYKGAR